MFDLLPSFPSLLIFMETFRNNKILKMAKIYSNGISLHGPLTL